MKCYGKPPNQIKTELFWIKRSKTAKPDTCGHFLTALPLHPTSPRKLRLQNTRIVQCRPCRQDQHWHLNPGLLISMFLPGKSPGTMFSSVTGDFCRSPFASFSSTHPYFSQWLKEHLLLLVDLLGLISSCCLPGSATVSDNRGALVMRHCPGL